MGWTPNNKVEITRTDNRTILVRWWCDVLGLHEKEFAYEDSAKAFSFAQEIFDARAM